MKRTPILLHLDTYRQELHINLGVSLDYLYRVNAGKPVKICMKALLENARIEIPEWAKERRAAQFIEKIEKTLSELYGLEALGEYSPQDILNSNTLPARGKLAVWLKTQYTFEPMAEVGELYQGIKNRQVKAIEQSTRAARAAQKKTSKGEGR